MKKLFLYNNNLVVLGERALKKISKIGKYAKLHEKRLLLWDRKDGIFKNQRSFNKIIIILKGVRGKKKHLGLPKLEVLMYRINNTIKVWKSV